MSIRTVDAVRSILLQKAQAKANPVIYVSPEVLNSAMAPLTSCDRDQWAARFCQVAQTFEEAASAAEAGGRPDQSIEALRTAYGLYWLARYPTTNSPGKSKAYEQARRTHAKLLSLIDPQYEIVTIPFSGRAGEGNIIRAFFRRPAESKHARVPLIVTWGRHRYLQGRTLAARRTLSQARLRHSRDRHAGHRRESNQRLS
jgi:esterase FrsA